MPAQKSLTARASEARKKVRKAAGLARKFKSRYYGIAPTSDGRSVEVRVILAKQPKLSLDGPKG